ncbi:MAG: 2-dehydropantoate 2-reductase [Proteobacteria bacterium]|nr:2-dehydropantoate 2-reductase [Burkholderiales bacterium]
MRVCVVGAGSIGGMVAVRMAAAGIPVTVVARGAHLQAIRAHGLRLINADGTEQVAHDMRSTERLRECGPHEVVILAVKATQLAEMACDVPSLLTDDGVVLPMQNGIPWWYFHRHGGPLAGQMIETVDPAGQILRQIDADRVLGCVVYPAAEIVEPGVIRQIEGERFALGELDGSMSDRLTRTAALFERAGMKAPLLEDVRAELWLKLWGNLTFNPVSALTHAPLSDICEFPASRELAAQMMAEAQTVAGKLGIGFRVSIDKRIAGAQRVGRHKTSMLQDIEAGREPEIEALVGSVLELARLTTTPAPRIEAVYALVKLLAATMVREQVKVRALPRA